MATSPLRWIKKNGAGDRGWGYFLISHSTITILISNPCWYSWGYIEHWLDVFTMMCGENDCSKRTLTPHPSPTQTRNNFVSTKQEVEKLMRRIRSADQDYKAPGRWSMEGFLYVQEKREWRFHRSLEVSLKCSSEETRILFDFVLEKLQCCQNAHKCLLTS